MAAESLLVPTIERSDGPSDGPITVIIESLSPARGYAIEVAPSLTVLALKERYLALTRREPEQLEQLEAGSGGCACPFQTVLRLILDGVELEDGPTARARVTAVEPNLLRITIHEGRNRQVRRMCDAVGHPVARLVRTRIGPITDPRLAPGEWRELTRDEVRSLEVASASEKPATGSEPPR